MPAAEPAKPSHATPEATLTFPLLPCRYQCSRPARDYTHTANRSCSLRGCHNTLFMPALHNFATVVCKSHALLETERRLLLHYEQPWRLAVLPHKYTKVLPCAAHRNRSLLLIATSWVCASSLQDEQLWLCCALKANIRSKLDQNYTRFPTLRFLLNCSWSLSPFHQPHTFEIVLFLNLNSMYLFIFLTFCFYNQNKLIISRYQTITRNFILFSF